jgi:nucleolar protein 56
MSERADDSAWFAGCALTDREATRVAIEQGRATESDRWPDRAVEAGVVEDTDEYYDLLHEVTCHAAQEAAQELEQADDQQLLHAIRSVDDCRRTANELTERVAEWAGTHNSDATVDVEYLRTIVDEESDDPAHRRVQSLAETVLEIESETAELQRFVDRLAPEVAPNLTALAGPELAARLISLAGGLEALAKQPSGTVQLLGAENALFAHLRGGAPSPKHGIIYTHEAVRSAAPEHRGSAARTLAGKLTIAARVDHYSGDLRPELQDELDERMERIHARDAS